MRGRPMAADYEFLHLFCSDVLATGKSVRWAGIVNKNGIIISQRTREGLKLILTEEENEEYAATAIARQKTRAKFESKIGRMYYALGRYEKLHRATIPISNNYYLLITMDVEEKAFDALIMDKVMSLIAEQRNRFMSADDSA